MIILIFGFSKSGTTLCAKTLHEVGINFGDITTGDYPGSPYEDPEGCKIIMDSLHIERKKSVFIPSVIDYDCKKIISYIHKRQKKNPNSWGFKFPYLTFVYNTWKHYLPRHTVFALKREPRSLLTHYTRNKPIKDTENANKILECQAYYNRIIDDLGVPVIHFEKLLANGPIEIEKVTGLKNLPDMRNYHGRGDGRKYLK